MKKHQQQNMKDLEFEKVGRSSVLSASVFQTRGVSTVALPCVAVGC